MENLAKNLGFFLKSLSLDGNNAAAPILKSPGFITEGDVLVFNFPPTKHEYPPPEPFRVVLAVRAYKQPPVGFTSKGTAILSGFLINGAPPPVQAMILKKMYKNRRAASYKTVVKNLGYILGSRNFRTFGLRKMSGLHEIQINKSKLSTLLDETE